MSHLPESDDPIDVIAEAFRTALAETPLHLRPLVRALKSTTENALTAAYHVRYEEHALVHENFSACRERLEEALVLLTAAQSLPDQLFDAEPV